MVLLFSLLILGVIAGYFLKEKEKIKKIIEKLVMYTIYLLLFFIGIKVGNNPQIVNNLHKIGLQAFLVAFSVVLGSIIVSALVYKFTFSKQVTKND